MGGTGVRYTGNNIRADIIAGRHFCTAVVTHLFYTQALVRAGRIAIINPEEGTDFHFLAGMNQGNTVFRCQYGNFAGT